MSNPYCLSLFDQLNVSRKRRAGGREGEREGGREGKRECLWPFIQVRKKEADFPLASVTCGSA